MSARKLATSTPTDVRAWGRENGFPTAERGRLGRDLIDAYNALSNTKRGNRLPFEGTHAPVPTEVTVEVARVGKTGRKLRPAVETVTHGTIRTWAREAGFDVPQRGRMPQYLIDAYTARNLTPAQ